MDRSGAISVTSEAGRNGGEFHGVRVVFEGSRRIAAYAPPSSSNPLTSSKPPPSASITSCPLASSETLAPDELGIKGGRIESHLSKSRLARKGWALRSAAVWKRSSGKG